LEDVRGPPEKTIANFKVFSKKRKKNFEEEKGFLIENLFP